MCLAIPVQIKEIIDENTAVAEISGLKKTISTALLEDVKVSFNLTGACAAVFLSYSLLPPPEAANFSQFSIDFLFADLCGSPFMIPDSL